MKISVITPTADRASYLQGAYHLLQEQTHPDWEWLIYDTSLHPTPFNDPRVTYIHDGGIVSIGEKRNRLIEKATGDVIVHFDDDDYYAPTYLTSVLQHLQRAAFFTVSSWFSYDTKTSQFFYWDTEEAGEIRYQVSALSGTRIREIELGPYMEAHKEQLNYRAKTGYGFSFAYHKEVWKGCRFRDIDLAEDRFFYEGIEVAGFPMDAAPDHEGKVIHVIHDTNTSAEYPQYRVPPFLVHPLFPAFLPYIRHYHQH